MLEKAFSAIIVTSIFGSIFFVLLFLIKPLTKKYFSSLWHYYIFFAVILVLIFPIRINISETKIQTEKENNSVLSYISYENVINSVSFEKVELNEKTEIDFSKIWCITAIAILLIKVLKYSVFTVKLKRKSKDVLCKNMYDYIPKNVRVRKSSVIMSPFVLGVFLPTVYLPEAEMTEEEIKYVLHHEITHIKRCDVLLKWVVMLAKCLHWFNPFVYFLAKEINLWCEISCDVSVTKNMDNSKKQSYVSTILKLIEKSRKKQILTTSMASSKAILGKRFRFIKLYKKRKNAFLSGMLSLLMILSFFILSGVTIGGINKEKAKEENKTYLKTVVNPPKKIESENKTERVEILKPADKINESAEALNIEKNDEVLILDSEIKQDDEILSFENDIKEDDEIQEDIENSSLNEELYFAGDVVIEKFNENMDTGRIIESENSNDILFRSPSDVVNLKTSHTWFNYSFDEKFSYTATVVPDNNGAISLFFDTEFLGATADIYINHIDRPNMGWGYKFPTDNKILYRFVGFEKNEKYQITISSYFPGNYNINGKALII